jgi:hypothetical protein
LIKKKLEYPVYFGLLPSFIEINNFITYQKKKEKRKKAKVNFFPFLTESMI